MSRRVGRRCLGLRKLFFQPRVEHVGDSHGHGDPYSQTSSAFSKLRMHASATDEGKSSFVAG